jgi:hypothetical protein
LETEGSGELMEWKIGQGKGQCAACSAGLVENQPFFSALIDLGVEFQRKDYCESCWAARTEEVFSYWKTRVPPKDTKKRPTIDDDALYDFFQRLETETEPSKQNFRYLLGLMLMRKRFLKFADIERVEEREFLVLRRPRENVMHRVLDPKLPEAELQKLKEDLEQLLYLEA